MYKGLKTRKSSVLRENQGIKLVSDEAGRMEISTRVVIHVFN